jgi:hypothetical protein
MDDKKKKRSNQHDVESSSSASDDPTVQQHVSSTNSAHGNPMESYYSSHIASVCAAMNNEAEKRMSPFEQLMLEKRRETNRLSARRCRKRRREEITHLEEEQRRLESESEELAAEKVRLQAELQREISNAEGTSSQTQAPQPDVFHPPFGNLLNMQQHHQFQQHMQLRQTNPAGAAPLDPISGFFPPALMTPSTGFDMASFPMRPSNVHQLAQVHGLDFSRTAAFSPSGLSASLPPRQAVEIPSYLPLWQANQRLHLRLHSHQTLGDDGLGARLSASMSPFAAATDSSRAAVAMLDRHRQSEVTQSSNGMTEIDNNLLHRTSSNKEPDSDEGSCSS